MNSPEVLVTLTQDEGKIISALHTVKQGGEADLLTGIQVAQVRLSFLLSFRYATTSNDETDRLSRDAHSSR